MCPAHRDAAPLSEGTLFIVDATYKRIQVVASPIQQDIGVAVAHGMIPAATLACLSEGDDVLLVSREPCGDQVRSAIRATDSSG
jgi:hypothetical protein